MPSGLIRDEHGMGVLVNHGADFFKMRLHGFRFAPRHDQARAFTGLGTDGVEYVSPLGALVMLVLSRFSSGLFRAMFAMKETRYGSKIYRRIPP